MMTQLLASSKIIEVDQVKPSHNLILACLFTVIKHSMTIGQECELCDESM